MIIKIDVCSNCRKPVPDVCDGQLYTLAVYPRRRVCLGGDGIQFVQDGGKVRCRLIKGHGEYTDVDLIPEKF